MLLAIGLALTAALGHSTPTSAAPAPESCFGFDAATGAITDYYDTEGNDPANPACPRAVEIPGTIGGVTVVAVGDSAGTAYTMGFKGLTSLTMPDSITSLSFGAFAGNQLTSVRLSNSLTFISGYAFTENPLGSVIIPDSVTSIEEFAFYNSQLTSLDLGNSVTSLGNNAFASNQLTSLMIPDSLSSITNSAFSLNRLTSLDLGDSVTSIQYNAFYGNQLTVVSIPNTVTSIDITAFGNQTVSGTTDRQYTRLYTVDPGNPNNLQDGVSYNYVDDGQGNFEFANAGGHLINPASTTLTYKTQSGEVLRPSETIVGKKDDSSVIPDYLVRNGPDVPEPADTPPSPAEEAAMLETLRVYYRLGSQQTFTAPQIAGYTGPVPVSPYTTTLAARDTTIDFVYTQAAPGTPPSQPTPGDGQGSGEMSGELSNTGINAALVMAIAAFVLGLGAALLLARQKLAKR